MVHFLHTGRKFFLASSVYDMYFSAETQGSPRGVHRHVSAAYHGHLLSAHDGRIGILAEGLHQIASGQIFIGGKYAVGIFPGDAHELGKARAGTDEYGRKALFLQKLVDGNGFAHDHVGFNLHAKGLHVFNFLLHHGFLGKTELGNPVNQHAAGLVKGLKNSHVIAHFSKIPRAGKARGAGTDHSHFLSLLFRGSFRFDPVFPRPVGHKALQLADGNGLALNASDTFSLALAFLRADAAADRRQCGGSADHLIRGLHIPFLHLFDKAGNIDGYRAALHALGVFAVDAAGSLLHRLFFIISQADLFKVGRPYLRILFSHRHLF